MGSLHGRRIVVTRAREENSRLCGSLRALGAEVLEVPTIRIVPPSSHEQLDAALARLHDYQVLLVTSANTARVLAERKPAPWEIQPWTVTVGPSTAAGMRAAGLRVDQQPEPSVAESVVRELAPGARGKRMLLPQAAVARDVLPKALREAGATVDVVEAYRTILNEDSRGVLAEIFGRGAPPVDAVTFTSSSTVENFWALLGQAAPGALTSAKACSIGPITSATLRRYGVGPAVEAEEYDVPGLVAAVLRLLGSSSGGSEKSATADPSLRSG